MRGAPGQVRVDFSMGLGHWSAACPSTEQRVTTYRQGVKVKDGTPIRNVFYDRQLPNAPTAMARALIGAVGKGCPSGAGHDVVSD